jgi:uncharacterized membrane protein
VRPHTCVAVQAGAAQALHIVALAVHLPLAPCLPAAVTAVTYIQPLPLPLPLPLLLLVPGMVSAASGGVSRGWHALLDL